MKKTTAKKSLPKAQLGSIVKGIAKVISTGAKVANKVSDVKNKRLDYIFKENKMYNLAKLLREEITN